MGAHQKGWENATKIFDIMDFTISAKSPFKILCQIMQQLLSIELDSLMRF